MNLPPLRPSDHPENQIMQWSKLEMEAIQDYAHQSVREAVAASVVEAFAADCRPTAAQLGAVVNLKEIDVSKKIEYVYSLDEETYHSGDCETREQAISLAVAERYEDGDEVGDEVTVWTGIRVDAIEVLAKCNFVARVVDDVDDWLSGAIPSDEAIMTVKDGQHDALKSALLAVFAEHCEFHRWGITDTKCHKAFIGEDDIQAVNDAESKAFASMFSPPPSPDAKP